MKELIKRYEGAVIGVNVITPNHIEPVTVAAAADTYFTVKPESTEDVYHLPYLNVVKVIENPDGITVKEFFHGKHTYKLVVKMGHMVQYVPS